MKFFQNSPVEQFQNLLSIRSLFDFITFLLAPTNQTIMNQQQVTIDLNDRRHELQDVEQREQATKEIVRDMQELHEVSKELANAVDGQEDLLNLTEANIQDAKTAQEQAEITIVKVDKRRSASKKIKLWCIIITVILLAIIILILVVVLL